MPDTRKGLVDELGPFGAPPSGVVALATKPTPAHLPYLDLCSGKSRGPRLPDAVVELERRPVLYVIRDAGGDSEIRRLQRVLAQRGQADYLAVLTPGQLVIYPLDLLGRAGTKKRVVQVGDSGAPLTIPRLALDLAEKQPSHTQSKFHDRLLNLLTSTAERIAASRNLDYDVALSWIGRALFLRFLIDRSIISETHVGRICGAPSLAHCFASPQWATKTCKWLDAVFNGDLLPLPHGGGHQFWQSLSKTSSNRLCSEISKILHRTDEHGQLSFDWDTLDFGHIPAGLLSQVYESYSHRFDRDRARRESVHYTPRAIAEYMIDEALYRLPNSDEARVLDPASGAGVFLVAAFRALVRERWAKTNKRPSRRTIRQILQRQIVGFDINEVAVRLAALSLYLTALELDPSPTPLSELRFENLRGIVLHDVRSELDKEAELEDLPIVGSLGPHISEVHRGAYDIVVGNPPWTAWKRPKAPKNQSKADEAFDRRVGEVEHVVRKTIASVMSEDRAENYRMVDNLPDLPFCWRALEWLRPHGRMALAINARFLFKQSATGVQARNLFLSAVRLTGILNGSALRKTLVWPKVSAPFCICFGENVRPSELDAFQFVSPRLEERLNKRGVMRIDAADATPVLATDVIERPTLLKSLYRGSSFDAAIIAKLEAKDYPTLDNYWTSLKLKSGHGFQIGGDARPPKSARRLRSLPMLTRQEDSPTRIIAEVLPKFAHGKILHPRERDLYRAPLVLMPESPHASLGGRVYYCDRDVVFNESYLGFSCHGHPRATALASYLFLILASDLIPYISLMRSSKFGVERDTYLLSDIKAVQVCPLERFDDGQIGAILSFADSALSDRVSRPEINGFVYQLYGLSSREQETIRDTLSVSSPFTCASREAQRRPKPAEVTTFGKILGSHLTPFFDRRGRTIFVHIIPMQLGDPWFFFEVVASKRRLPPSSTGLTSATLGAMVAEADAHGAARIVYRGPRESTLIIGLLSQYRYWTPTRARLLSIELRAHHEEYLVGGSKT
jgi:N-6 DNA Methylase